jgi:hypothetical protein
MSTDTELPDDPDLGQEEFSPSIAPDHPAHDVRLSPRDPISAHHRAGFASIGKAISLAKDWDGKLLAWRNGLHGALTKWNGVLRTDAVSECWNIAEAKELIDHFGADEIQRILSDEVLKAAAAEPQKTDGHGEFPDAARAGKLPNVLPFILFDEINVTPKAWLAKDFLGAGEMSCWYGHPGDGKSVLVEDFGLHVAAHMPWHDREVLGGAVLYIALERVQLVKRRAWPSRSSTMSPAFPSPSWAECLISAIGRPQTPSCKSLPNWRRGLAKRLS